jgi:hypothetical protein
MQLKLQDIQTLTELNMSLVMINQEITDYTKLAEQLAHEHCSVSVSFTMTNETKKREAEAKAMADDIMKDPLDKYQDKLREISPENFGAMMSSGIRGMMLMPLKEWESIVKPVAVLFKFSEADALILFNTMIQRKKAARKEIVDQMKRITGQMWLDENNLVIA